MAKTPLIKTVDLTKIYGNGNEIRALDGVNTQIARGEFIAVMGPSGSGKSTLLNMLGALDRPTRGQVHINGQELSQIQDLDQFRARQVGFVFQLHNLIPTLDAVENVEVPMQGQGRSRSARRQRALNLLEMVGLGGRLHHLPAQLSGGQRQRVAIARALANEPALVLADEPTGNLDSQSGGEIIALLRQLNQDLCTTFVIVTHDLKVARQTNRVLLMQDGQIVDDHQVGHPFVEDFKTFRDSGLGQALLSGDTNALQPIGTEGHALLKMLQQAAQ